MQAGKYYRLLTGRKTMMQVGKYYMLHTARGPEIQKLIRRAEDNGYYYLPHYSEVELWGSSPSTYDKYGQEIPADEVLNVLEENCTATFERELKKDLAALKRRPKSLFSRLFGGPSEV